MNCMFEVKAEMICSTCPQAVAFLFQLSAPAKLDQSEWLSFEEASFSLLYEFNLLGFVFRELRVFTLFFLTNEVELLFQSSKGSVVWSASFRTIGAMEILQS